MSCLPLLRRYDIKHLNRRSTFGPSKWSAVLSLNASYATAPKPRDRHRVVHRLRDFHKLNEFINADSLDETLRAHREANQDQKIRKIGAGAASDVFRPYVESLVVSESIEHHRGPQSHSLRELGLTREFLRQVEQEAQKLLPKNGSLSLATTDGRQAIRRANAQVMVQILKETSNLGWLEPEVEKEFQDARRLMLEKYEQSPEPFPGEDTWPNQAETLRRIRQTLRRSEAEVYKDTDLSFLVKSRGFLEYIGKYIQHDHKGSAPMQDEPWASQTNQESRTVMDRLNDEIVDFAEWMEPTETEKLAREHVFDVTLRMIQTEVPNLSATRFGSQTTGLAVPTSDADIRLYHADFDFAVSPGDVTYKDRREELTNGLSQLELALNKHSDYDNVVKRDARFPMISADHKPSGLKVQIVCGAPTRKSAALVRDSLEKYPHLKTLFMIVKTALDIRGLSQIWNGGLGSYSIFNMILAIYKMQESEQEYSTMLKQFEENETLLFNRGLVPVEHWNPSSQYEPITGLDLTLEEGLARSQRSFLTPAQQMAPPDTWTQILQSATPSTSPASMLLSFLTFYSQVLDHYAYGVSASKGALFRKKSSASIRETQAARDNVILRGQLAIAQPLQQQKYLLCLQDAADPYNDLGRASYSYKHVVVTLGTLRDFLNTAIADGEQAAEATAAANTSVKSTKGKGAANMRCLLRLFVGRCDIEFDARRARLELYGEEIQQKLEMQPPPPDIQLNWPLKRVGRMSKADLGIGDVDQNVPLTKPARLRGKGHDTWRLKLDPAGRSEDKGSSKSESSPQSSQKGVTLGEAFGVSQPENFDDRGLHGGADKPDTSHDLELDGNGEGVAREQDAAAREQALSRAWEAMGEDGRDDDDQPEEAGPTHKKSPVVTDQGKA